MCPVVGSGRATASRNQRPRSWSVPTRVELAEDVVIQFRVPPGDSNPLEQARIGERFEAGSLHPPRTTSDGRDAPTAVTLTGAALFLVGEVDLGRKVSIAVLASRMNVLARDMEVDIEAAAQGPSNAPVRTDAGEEGARNAPESQLRDQGTVQLATTLDEASRRWDELRPRTARWDLVALTENGVRVAAIVGWGWWTSDQHRRTSLEGAYWGHWHSGELAAAAYGWDVLRVLEPQSARKWPVVAQEGDDHDLGAVDAA